MTDPQWVPPGHGAPQQPQGQPSHPAQPAPPEGPPAHMGAAPAYAPTLGVPHQGMEFRPGIIPLRPLGLGDVYGAVIKAVRGNVGATMGLALLTTLVFLVPTTALGAWIASLESLDFQSTEDVFPVAGMLGSYVPALGTGLSAVLLTGFLAFVIGQAVMGRKVSAGQTWEGTRSRLPLLVAATFVTGLIIGLALCAVLVVPAVLVVAAVRSGDESGLVGTILLAVLAVLAAIALVFFLSTRLAFVGVVVVLEKAGLGAALARSWRLTGGREFWRVLGIRLLTGLVVGIAAQVLSVPISLLGGLALVATDDPSRMFVWQAVISGLSGLITGAITTPFTAGVDALLYVDQRIRREGFDVALVSAAQAGLPRP
jgi:hypothetical protein